MPFRIPVHISDAGPPFVVARAYWLKKGSTAKVGLLVDTGAFDISLSEDTVKALGGRLKDLPRSRTSVTGIGGRARVFEMDNVVLFFPCEGGRSWDVQLDTGRVIAAPMEGGKRGAGVVPDLMGRGFMERHRLILFWDFAERMAYLEAKGVSHGYALRAQE